MDIRFCSVCNESVPDTDFDSGRALIDGSESLHVACALRRSLEGRRVGRVLWMALALYAAAISTYVFVRSLDAGEPQAPTVNQAVQQHVVDAVAQSEGRTREWVDARATDVRTAVLEEATQSLLKEVSRLLDVQARAIDTRMADNTTIVHDRLKDLSERLRALDGRVEPLTQWRIEIQKQADLLEAALQGAHVPATAGTGPAAGPGPGPGDPPAAGPGPGPEAGTERSPERDELVAKWIERLGDADDNVVFTATIELARLKALSAAAALVGVLEKHRDFYARLGAATALGEIPALDGVPALIEALGDRDELVRTAADDSLRKITGEDFNFSSSLPKNDRSRIQRRWRQYWKDNETTLRERLGQ